ncbi:MAG: alkaline phosphatase PhoX [Myxococcota bacterium]
MFEHRTDRRRFLKAGQTLAGGALAAPFAQLVEEQKALGGRFPLSSSASPYGPLRAVADGTTGLPLLRLPPGFRYFSMGWTGDLMSDGTLTPDRHDGMAVVSARGWGRRQRVTLIRNHERGASDPTNPLAVVGNGSAPVYDPFVSPGVISGLGGGTTSLVIENGRLVRDQATLGGTLSNCAGGPTPWCSWLTCEETTVLGGAIGARDHGFVYEVPDPALGPASARPIPEMGLMDHEAVAVDRRTSEVYITEDNGPNSGFYRFTPHDRSCRVGSLEQGGVLDMLKVKGVDRADLRTPEQGAEYEVEWIRVDNPTRAPETLVSPAPGFPAISGQGKSGPFLEGEAKGAAFFARGEGCWPGRRGIIYWVDTSGGPAGKGVLWAYVPGRGRRWGRRRHRRPDRLIAVFVSPNAETADNPDNVVVSPRGGILMCEDGGGLQDANGVTTTGARLIGLNPWGTAFPFAENAIALSQPIPDKPFILPDDYRGREFAGATFDPRGRWLFVNIQTPGVTFAITGPFRRGPL